MQPAARLAPRTPQRLCKVIRTALTWPRLCRHILCTLAASKDRDGPLGELFHFRSCKLAKQRAHIYLALEARLRGGRYALSSNPLSSSVPGRRPASGTWVSTVEQWRWEQQQPWA